MFVEKIKLINDFGGTLLQGTATALTPDISSHRFGITLLYSAPVLTNQSASYIFHYQSESKTLRSVLVSRADPLLVFQNLVCN